MKEMCTKRVRIGCYKDIRSSLSNQNRTSSAFFYLHTCVFRFEYASPELIAEKLNECCRSVYLRCLWRLGPSVIQTCQHTLHSGSSDNVRAMHRRVSTSNNTFQMVL